MLFDHCDEDPDCLALSPSLEEDVDSLLEQARTSPHGIEVQGTVYAEDEELFLMALQYMVGDSWWRFRLPRALHEATSGDYARWDILLSEVFGVTVTHVQGSSKRGSSCTQFPFRPVPSLLSQSSYVAPALFMTVICAESLPNAPSIGELDALAATQEFGDDHPVELARACAAWDVDAIGEQLRSPVVSDVPVLLLSGEIDINTFPEWGDHAAETLREGRHVVVPFATHSTMLVPCVGDIIVDSFEAFGDPSSVDMSCIGELAAPWE